jgi:hypothetical protein
VNGKQTKQSATVFRELLVYENHVMNSALDVIHICSCRPNKNNNNNNINININNKANTQL